MSSAKLSWREHTGLQRVRALTSRPPRKCPNSPPRVPSFAPTSTLIRPHECPHSPSRVPEFAPLVPDIAPTSALIRPHECPNSPPQVPEFARQ
eukprot:122721-Prorocentrum_minimum.AAC.1